MTYGLELPIVDRRLPGGLRVLVQPDSSLPLVAVQGSFAVGAHHDPEDEPGLAHLVEHVVADHAEREARSFPELIRRLGGTSGAVTYGERTAYSALLPAEHWRWAVRMELGRLASGAAACSAEAFERYRATIRQETLKRAAEPYASSFERLQALLYPQGHPHRRHPLGDPESLGRMTPGSVRGFHRRFYRKSRLTLVVVGDVDPDRVLSEVDDYRAEAAEADAAAAPATPAAPACKAGRYRATVREAAPAPRVFLGLCGPGMSMPSWTQAMLAFRWLTVGRSSPVRARLIGATGLAQGMASLSVQQRDASSLVVAAGAAAGVELSRLEDELLTTVLSSIDRGPSEKELELTRVKAITDLFGQLERRQARADLLGSAATLGGELPDRYLSRLLGASQEEVGAAGAALTAAGPVGLLAWQPEAAP